MGADAGSAIKFTSGGAFHKEVDRQVKQLLADRGLVRRAYLLLWAKAALVLLWAAASYVVLVFVAEGPLQALAASVSLGLAAAGIGFTIMHDANHQAFARQPLGQPRDGALARPDRRFVVRVVGQAPRPPHLPQRHRARSGHRQPAVRPLRPRPESSRVAPLPAHLHLGALRDGDDPLAVHVGLRVPAQRPRRPQRCCDCPRAGRWQRSPGARACS